MSPDKRSPESRRKSPGDYLALAILAAFFAGMGFALNPKGWGAFDWIAVSAFSLAALWNLYRFASGMRRTRHT